MPGMFDDLIPASAAPTGGAPGAGLFDDLVPQAPPSRIRFQPGVLDDGTVVPASPKLVQQFADNPDVQHAANLDRNTLSGNLEAFWPTMRESFYDTLLGSGLDRRASGTEALNQAQRLEQAAAGPGPQRQGRGAVFDPIQNTAGLAAPGELEQRAQDYRTQGGELAQEFAKTRLPQRAEAEAIPSFTEAEGPVMQPLAALLSGTATIGGGLASPESLVPVGRGATLARTALKGGLVNAITTGATDPLVQNNQIAAGLRESYDPAQTLLSAGAGGVIGGTLNVAPEIMQGVRRLLAGRRGVPEAEIPDADINDFMRQTQEAEQAAAAQRAEPNFQSDVINQNTGLDRAAPTPTSPQERAQVNADYRQRQRELSEAFREPEVWPSGSVTEGPGGIGEILAGSQPVRDPTGAVARPDELADMRNAADYLRENGGMDPTRVASIAEYFRNGLDPREVDDAMARAGVQRRMGETAPAREELGMTPDLERDVRERARMDEQAADAFRIAELRQGRRDADIGAGRTPGPDYGAGAPTLGDQLSARMRQDIFERAPAVPEGVGTDYPGPRRTVDRMSSKQVMDVGEPPVREPVGQAEFQPGGPRPRSRDAQARDEEFAQQQADDMAREQGRPDDAQGTEETGQGQTPTEGAPPRGLPEPERVADETPPVDEGPRDTSGYDWRGEEVKDTERLRGMSPEKRKQLRDLKDRADEEYSKGYKLAREGVDGYGKAPPTPEERLQAERHKLEWAKLNAERTRLLRDGNENPIQMNNLRERERRVAELERQLNERKNPKPPEGETPKPPKQEGKPAPAPEPAKPKARGQRKTVDKDKDSLVQAAIRLGGAKREWQTDTTGDSVSSRSRESIPGVGSLWSDKTGTSLDDLASRLHEHGYIPAGEMEKDGGVSFLQDAIRDELHGRKTHYATESSRANEQLETEALQRHQDAIAAEADRNEARYQDIADEHGQAAADRVREHDEAQQANIDQLQREADEYAKREAEQDAADDGGEADTGTGSAGPETPPGERAGESAGRRDSVSDKDQGKPEGAGEKPKQPDFDLKSQTESELSKQAKEAAAKEKARAAESKKADERAQADKDRDDFNLTGSDRASDVGASRGQDDMFAPGRLNDITSAIHAVLRRLVQGDDTASMKDNVHSLAESIASMWGGHRPTKRGIFGDTWRRVAASADGNMRMLTKPFKSPTAKRLADVFHATAGKGDGTKATFDERMQQEMNPRMNKIEDMSEWMRKNKLNNAESREQIIRMVENPTTPRKGKMGEAANRISALLADADKYLREAGIDFGHVKGYFPRELDQGKVLGARKEFMQAATKAYQKDNPGMKLDEAQRMAESYWDSAAYGDSRRPGEPTRGGNKPSFLKGRTFSKDAAKEMEKFYVRDIDAVLSQYVSRAVKRAELAKSGVDIDGKFQPFGDNFEHWDKIEQAIRKEDPDAAAIMPELNELVSTSAGMQPRNVSQAMQQASSWTRTATTLGSLEKSAFASIGELAMAPMRGTVGNLGDAPNMVGNLAQHAYNTVRSLGGKGARSKKLQEMFDFAEDVAAIAGSGHHGIMAARFAGGDPAGQIQSKILGSFFKRNLLEQLTNYTRATTVNQGRVFLRRLAADNMQGKARTKLLLRELGVQPGQEDAFSKFVAGFGKDLPRAEQLAGPHGQAYRTAMLRFADQSVMRPNQSTRPKWASTPLGSMVFQLQAFNYAFQKNVINRNARLLAGKNDIPGMEKLGMGAAMGANMAAMVAIQGAVGELRDKLFSRPDSREVTKGGKIEQALSRAGAFGVADPYIQMAGGGVRYGASPVKSLLGPFLGGMASNADALAKLYGPNNSEKTNTMERQAFRQLYGNLAEPLLQAALSVVPAGPLANAATIYGVPKSGEKLVDAVLPADAKTKAQKPIQGIMESLMGDKKPESGGRPQRPERPARAERPQRAQRPAR